MNLIVTQTEYRKLLNMNDNELKDVIYKLGKEYKNYDDATIELAIALRGTICAMLDVLNIKYDTRLKYNEVNVEDIQVFELRDKLYATGLSNVEYYIRLLSYFVEETTVTFHNLFEVTYKRQYVDIPRIYSFFKYVDRMDIYNKYFRDSLCKNVTETLGDYVFTLVPLYTSHNVKSSIDNFKNRRALDIKSVDDGITIYDIKDDIINIVETKLTKVSRDYANMFKADSNLFGMTI